MELGAVEGAGFPSAGTDGAGGFGRRPGACRLPGGTFECGAGGGCAGGSLSRHGRRCGCSSCGWRLSVPLFFPGASGGDSVFHPGFRMFTALWAHSTVPFTATSAVLPASGRNVTGMFPATATLPCGKYWKPCGKFPGKNNLGRDGMPPPALAEKRRECCRCRKE